MYEKTKYFEPYEKLPTSKSNGICTLKHTGSGVYFIKENDTLLYIGMSTTDVKKVMYRHFQVWNDKRPNSEKKLSYFTRKYYGKERLKNIKCKVIFTKTAKQAIELESALIIRLKPKDNENKLAINLSNYKLDEIEILTDIAPTIQPSDVPF